MTAMLPRLIGPLLVLAGLCTVYAIGYLSGQSAAQASADRATVAAQARQLEQYRAAVAEHTALIAASQAASQAIRATASAMETTNRRTTHALKQALELDAAERADCRYDDGVMQHLVNARQRAADAAAGRAPGRPDAKLPAPGAGAAGGG
ncbi:hypothetical protein EBQ24_08855 [Allofranklinella schreckenbergeri]|uniref:Uncharacterized protein n=1 Tax=Allofranklinella schreckenbergeri TaxID=1076744 RepID=A0A3M6QWS5_9BURK|nr:hypothetical protein [Allofranklinella schreckenbergeri]RMX07434.1 hypothetical protein EBQ24_08855 [Allofranklinella schreckenbergeri]